MKSNAFWVGFAACASLTGRLLPNPAPLRGAASTRPIRPRRGKGFTRSNARCAMAHRLQDRVRRQHWSVRRFFSSWVGQTVGDLSSKLQATMPATNPGSLKPDQVSELVAFILKSNHYPAGKTRLPSEHKQLEQNPFRGSRRALISRMGARERGAGWPFRDGEAAIDEAR